MKKFKVCLHIFAVIIAAAAVAFRPQQACTGLPQFYFNGTNYHAAGVLGRDYYCATGISTCTYYAAGNFYVPCQTGLYFSFHAKASKR